MFSTNKINQKFIKSIILINQRSSSSSSAKHGDKVSIIPHPTSKLRLFNYAIPENESDYERKVRELRIQVQNFNHEYWSAINTEFNQKKAQYIENELKNKNNEIDYNSAETHEELAQFYKKFLDDNHRKYIQYNSQWYRNNMKLLWHSFAVSIIRLFKRFY